MADRVADPPRRPCPSDRAGVGGARPPRRQRVRARARLRERPQPGARNPPSRPPDAPPCRRSSRRLPAGSERRNGDARADRAARSRHARHRDGRRHSALRSTRPRLRPTGWRLWRRVARSRFGSTRTRLGRWRRGSRGGTYLAARCPATSSSGRTERASGRTRRGPRGVLRRCSGSDDIPALRRGIRPAGNDPTRSGAPQIAHADRAIRRAHRVPVVAAQRAHGGDRPGGRP